MKRVLVATLVVRAVVVSGCAMAIEEPEGDAGPKDAGACYPQDDVPRIACENKCHSASCMNKCACVTETDE